MKDQKGVRAILMDLYLASMPRMILRSLIPLTIFLASCSSLDKDAENGNASTESTVSDLSSDHVNWIQLDLSCPEPRDAKKSHRSPFHKKLERLKDLDQGYVLKETEGRQMENSLFHTNLQKIPSKSEMISNSSSSGEYKKDSITFDGWESFRNGVDTVRFAFVKGQKKVQGNIYARASIEEWTFHSPLCAKKLERAMDSIRSTLYWEAMYKGGHHFFREGKRAYYIKGGGTYMAGEILQNIPECIQDDTTKTTIY